MAERIRKGDERALNKLVEANLRLVVATASLLWTWQALLVFGVIVVVMLVQVRSEEQRLRRDFGEEYEAYCRRTGRFGPVSFKK